MLVPPASTIADGIAVREVGTLTLPLFEKYVDELVTVEDEEIAMAILWLLEKEKTVAEGAGAAALAAMLRHKTTLTDKKVAVIVSGGNIDVLMISHIIERGMVKDGRLVRVRVELPDHPGGLQKLAGLIAALRANIVQATHDRTYFGVALGNTIIDLTIETRGPEHVEQILERLTEAEYRSTECVTLSTVRASATIRRVSASYGPFIMKRWASGSGSTISRGATRRRPSKRFCAACATANSIKFCSASPVPARPSPSRK